MTSFEIKKRVAEFRHSNFNASFSCSVPTNIKIVITIVPGLVPLNNRGGVIGLHSNSFSETYICQP